MKANDASFCGHDVPVFVLHDLVQGYFRSQLYTFYSSRLRQAIKLRNSQPVESIHTVASSDKVRSTSTGGNVKVFISWSGEKSKAVALFLKVWLPSINQLLDDPWVSDVDIESGANWSASIGTQLNECKYGIVCVTQENQSRTWLNFEAGAISKLFGNAVPLLVDFDSKASLVAGPLAQLQVRTTDSDDMFKLMRDMNNAIERVDGKGLTAPVLDSAFSRGFDEFEREMENIRQRHPVIPTVERSDREKLDEILGSVRSLVRGRHTIDSDSGDVRIIGSDGFTRIVSDPARITPADFARNLMLQEEQLTSLRGQLSQIYYNNSADGGDVTQPF